MLEFLPCDVFDFPDQDTHGSKWTEIKTKEGLLYILLLSGGLFNINCLLIITPKLSLKKDISI